MALSKSILVATATAGLAFLGACSRPAPADQPASDSSAAVQPIDAAPVSATPVDVTPPPVSSADVQPSQGGSTDAGGCRQVQMGGVWNPMTGEFHPGPVLTVCSAPPVVAPLAAPPVAAPIAAEPVAAPASNE